MKKLSKQFFNIISSQLLGHFAIDVLCYTLFLVLQLGNISFNKPIDNALKDIPQESSQRDYAQIATNFRSNNTRILRNSNNHNRNKKLFNISNCATISVNTLFELPKRVFIAIKTTNCYYKSNLLITSIPIRAGPIVC
jgi:ABC-type maltose transport system permease subunit